MSQPGAGKGFVPINNFNGSAIADRNNPAYGSRKQHTTYGKHDRNAKSIGIQRHSGQQKYLERNPGHKPATSHGSSPSYSSPVKRRKTEHPNPVPESLHTVLEIDDSEEDEIQQLPAQHASTPRAQSILSSRSPHSTTSKRSGAGSKPASQPTSEFANTDSFLQPKRVKSSRRRGSKGPNDRRAAQDEVPFLSSGSLSQARSVTDEGFEESLTTTRSIFDGFEQGVHQNPSRHNQPQQAMERVTSKHFPTMRINESTAETENHATQAPRGGSQTTRNLRDYQPTGFKIGGDLVEGSDDELAQPTPDIMKARRKKSPSIHVQKGRGAPDLESLTGKCYRLDYARSYDLQAESKKLMLRQIKNDAKIFRLADEDPEGNVETIDEVNLSKINAVTSDNLARMRIMGPFKNGSRYWFDLKFEDRNEFREFLHTWVLPEAVQKHVYTE
jgi:sentrin-specific protease 7